MCGKGKASRKRKRRAEGSDYRINFQIAFVKEKKEKHRQ